MSVRTEIHTCMQASPFWDRLVFNKIKQRLGGRVRILVSGAAPLPRHVSAASPQAETNTHGVQTRVLMQKHLDNLDARHG